MCKIADLVVMVVEPNPLELKSACDSLNHLGIKRILCVETYTQAIESLSQEKDVDIVLADYEIEEGKELGSLLVSVIRSEYPGVLVILTSKDYSCSVVLDSIRINADDILDKNRKNDIELLVPKWIALAQLKNKTREILYGTTKTPTI